MAEAEGTAATVKTIESPKNSVSGGKTGIALAGDACKNLVDRPTKAAFAVWVYRFRVTG